MSLRSETFAWRVERAARIAGEGDGEAGVV